MAYGATLTLPTIAGSPTGHADFPILLKEADFPTGAIDGGANSIDNGGGNLRAYTTSAKTTQLPIDIVSFVAGGTPAAEVYVKIPTAATSETIFIESDDVETAQPAVTATYGRNAVWTDYESVGHLVETANTDAGGYTDSTGNNDGTGISMALSLVAGPFGGDVAKFDGSNDRIEFPISLAASDDVFTIQAWSNPDDLTVDQRLFSLLGATNNASAEITWMDADGSGDGWRAQAKDASTVINTVGLDSSNDASATWQMIHHAYGSSNIIYVDGSSSASGSGTSNFSDGTGDADTAIIANLWQLTGTGAYFDGAIAAFRLRMSVLSADWISTEYDNQNSSTAWVTVGTWADDGAGGGTTLLQMLNHTRYGGMRI